MTLGFHVGESVTEVIYLVNRGVVPQGALELTILKHWASSLLFITPLSLLLHLPPPPPSGLHRHIRALHHQQPLPVLPGPMLFIRVKGYIIIPCAEARVGTASTAEVDINEKVKQWDDGPFWAEAPKGRCPVRHRGEFRDVRPSVHPSFRPSVLPPTLQSFSSLKFSSNNMGVDKCKLPIE